MIGQTISHYKILEKLGEGGMGVVYKAQDTKLNRTVALKFLPDHVNQDPAAKERFLQEAQAAAGLNHPNICTIYGVDEHEGHLFISMEYVEGGTLREKLPFTRIDEAIAVASQIGEALQEAHAKGIVHRDVKADNIMLTSKGQAKVMDFGLAKLKGSLKVTRTSSTVGTLGYMAPEQIQGGEVDHRSDIFSFGVLLFEMITGRLPFRGEHEAAIVYSIVNEEPQDITALVPHVPPIVTNLIQRCLEKDPAERYQHFDDIVADLKRAQRKTSKVMRSSPDMKPVAGESVESAESSSPPKATADILKKPLPLIGGAIIGLALIVLLVWSLSGPSLPQFNPNMEISTLQIPAIEYYYPGISPDGKWLTFPGSDMNGKWDIYMMLIETGESKRITNDSTANLGGASTARFSPDGTLIAYGRRDPKTFTVSVCVVSVLTGQVRVVADSGVSPRWSPADNRIFYYRSGRGTFGGQTKWREYWSVSAKGGDERVEYIDSLAEGATTLFSFGVSPDSKNLAFTRPTGGQGNEVFILNLETRKERQLTRDGKSIDEVVWADNGYMFYTSDRTGNFNIWAIPEDGGEPVQVTKGAGPDNGLTFSKAANRIVFSQRTPVNTAWMVRANGTEQRQLFPEENIWQMQLSPDGKKLVLVVANSLGQRTLMVRDFGGGNQEMLLPPDSSWNRSNPQWSPNGKMVAYDEFRPNSTERHTKVIDVAGGRRVRDLGNNILFNRWLSDTTLSVSRNTSTDPDRPQYTSLRVLNLNSGSETVFFRDTVSARPVLSNTAILYSDQDGIRLLSMDTFHKNPSAEGKLLIRFSEFSFLRTSDSWLYYRTPKRDALWRMNYRTGKRSKITDLRPADNTFFDQPGYNDEILTYVVSKTKTSIVKIDNVFIEN